MLTCCKLHILLINETRVNEHILEKNFYATINDKIKLKNDLDFNEDMKENNKNSFAVLNKSELISIGTKMGVNPEAISFQKIDTLKDLEFARSNLDEANLVLARRKNHLS